MKSLFIALFIFNLFACNARQETILQDDKDLLPEGAVPIQYDGNEIFYDFNPNDSIKFKVIVDSGIESFLIDSTFIANNSIGIKDAEDPKWIVVTMHNAFKPDGFRVYGTKVDRTISPLLANKMMMVWTVNFSRIAVNSDTVKGIIPLKAFAKNEIININLKKKYLLSLDFVNEEKYIRIPFQIINNVPTIDIELLFSRNDETCSIRGNFMIDYGFVGSIGIKAATAISKPLTCEQENSNILEGVRDTVDIQLNGITMQNTPIQKSIITVDDFVGVLGSQFLAHFDVVLDYKNKLMYLRKIEE